MARRTVRSLIPSIAAASRAEYGPLSAAPATKVSAMPCVVCSSMTAGASPTGGACARGPLSAVLTRTALEPPRGGCLTLAGIAANVVPRTSYESRPRAFLAPMAAQVGRRVTDWRTPDDRHITTDHQG